MVAAIRDGELNCKGVYLLHFDRPYKHAKHYTGYANNIAARVAQHRNGTGARLMEVIKQEGVGFVVARIWRGASRTDERRIKNRKEAPTLCPVCREARGH